MAKVNTNKEFTVVGVSLHNGEYKVRYANSLKRRAVLERNAHTNVQLFEMPFAGMKEDAVDALLNVLEQVAEAARECVLQEAREMGFRL